MGHDTTLDREARKVTWEIAGRALPRYWLGDHGFLRRYGSRLTIKEITERMAYAVSRVGSIGLAAGDERCLRAASAACGKAISRAPIMYHTDLPLALDGRRIQFGRCMSTLYHAVQAWSPDYVASDALVGKFLVSFARYRPYSPAEAGALLLGEGALDQEMDRIRRFCPDVVTVGGDWLDFACAAGRADLVREALEFFGRLCRLRCVPLLVTTYTGPITVGNPRETFPPENYDGLMLCVNRAGQGMVPDRERLLEWADSLGKPVLAMHALAIGKLPPLPALEYVLGEADAAAVVVGASRYEHIDTFADAVHSLREGR